MAGNSGQADRTSSSAATPVLNLFSAEMVADKLAGCLCVIARTSGRNAILQRAAIRSHKLKSSHTANDSLKNPTSSRQRRRATTVGVKTKQLRTRFSNNFPEMGGGSWVAEKAKVSLPSPLTAQLEQTSAKVESRFSRAIWRSSFSGSHSSSASRKATKELSDIWM